MQAAAFLIATSAHILNTNSKYYHLQELTNGCFVFTQYDWCIFTAHAGDRFLSQKVGQREWKELCLFSVCRIKLTT